MVVIWSFRQRREIRGLGDVEIGHTLAEISQRCLCDAVASSAQIDIIEVELKQLVFGEGLAHADCEQHFLHLPFECPVIRQEEVLGYLLRDRRGTDQATAAQAIFDIREQGLSDAERIDTGMAVEILVLGGEKSAPYPQRHSPDRHEKTLLAGKFRH